MRGYPKYVATKQDFLNLLAMPEYKAQALEELKNIVSLDDSTAMRATIQIDLNDPRKGWNMVKIENPLPLWRLKGFASRQEVVDIIPANGSASYGKQENY